MVREHMRVACLREMQSSIKDSVKQLVEDKIATLGLGPLFKITEQEIVGPNESLMVFKGLRNHTAASIKSLAGFRRAFVEEAQTISRRSLEILIPTIRDPGAQLMFAWNPEHESDPIEVFFEENKNDPEFICVTVDYTHNPWFPDKLRRDMERDRERDPEKYAHIWLGGFQRNSETRVFKHWKIGTVDIPKDARPYYGGDWGFAVDPSVLVRCWVIGRTLYIDQEAYKIGCPIDETPALFDTVEGAKKWPITADSARPETIDYMRRHGYPHIQSARKGPGSLEDGVEFLKSCDIIVHPDCRHASDELGAYSYKTDKLTGEVLPVLEDRKNHVIDAIRYALEGMRVMDGGTVFAAPEGDVVIRPFEVPQHWRRVWALDIDGAKASCLWAAHEKEGDTLYIYAECVTSRAELSLIADAIRKRGLWIPGLFDHVGRKRNKQEGMRITDALLDMNLEVFTVPADPEAGAAEVSRRLATKRLKVFATCSEWLNQYRAYRRDKDGQLVSEGDGLMRAMDLLALSGPQVSAPDTELVEEVKDEWAATSRDSITGY